MHERGFRQVALLGLCMWVTVTGTQAQQAAPLQAPGQRATAADPLAWSALTAGQRDILAPLAPYWTSIDVSRKSKWLEVATRYPAMHPEEQSRMRARMAEWAKMTPAERGRARLTFQESRQLTREEKQAHWEIYSTLSPEARQVLAEHGQRKRTEVTRPPAPAAPVLGAAAPKAQQAPRVAATPPVKTVAPTVVQARPGATTVPVTKAPQAAVINLVARPKINANPDQVDPRTLLPRQKAATAAPPATAASKPASAATTEMAAPATPAASVGSP